MARSIPDVLTAPAEEKTATKEHADEDSIRGMIARMEKAMAVSGERGPDFRSKSFDWMACKPSHPLHPVRSALE